MAIHCPLIMCPISFQDNSIRAGAYSLTIHYRGLPYLLCGEENARLNDLERFMWTTCHLYEDEQSYTIVDDVTCPPLLPGILLSMFPTLYLTVVVSLRHDIIPLRYQRWYAHRDPTIYRNSLSLYRMADEHMSYLPAWFQCNRYDTIDIHLAHPRVEAILSLVILYLSSMERVRQITLWNIGTPVASLEILHLFQLHVTRVKSESRPLRVSVQEYGTRMTLASYVGAQSAPTPPSREADRHSLPSREADRHSLPSREADRHSLPSREADRHSLPSREADRHSLPSREADEGLNEPIPPTKRARRDSGPRESFHGSA